jgi:hypothetical protein
MYLNIISPEDLENHPYFDNKPLNKPDENAELQDILVLLKLRDYREIEKACEEFNLINQNDYLVGMIAVFQKQGMYAFAAKLKAIGDMIHHVDTSVSAFALVQNPAFSELCEVATELFEQKINEKNAILIFKRITIPSDLTITTFDMLNRFLRKETKSSYPLLLLYKHATAGKSDVTASTLSCYLLGMYGDLDKQYQLAIENLAEACTGIISLKLYVRHDTIRYFYNKLRCY